MTDTTLSLVKTQSMYVTNKHKRVFVFILNFTDKLYLKLVDSKEPVQHRVLSSRDNYAKNSRYVNLILKPGDVVVIEKNVNGIISGDGCLVRDSWQVDVTGKLVSVGLLVAEDSSLRSVNLLKTHANIANKKCLDVLGISEYLVAQFKRAQPIHIAVHDMPVELSKEKLNVNYILYAGQYLDDRYGNFIALSPNNVSKINIAEIDVIFALPLDQDQRSIACYTNDKDRLETILSNNLAFYACNIDKSNIKPCWTILPKHTINDF